jgi:hypothetical protein
VLRVIGPSAGICSDLNEGLHEPEVAIAGASLKRVNIWGPCRSKRLQLVLEPVSGPMLAKAR